MQVIHCFLFLCILIHSKGSNSSSRLSINISLNVNAALATMCFYYICTLSIEELNCLGDFQVQHSTDSIGYCISQRLRIILLVFKRLVFQSSISILTDIYFIITSFPKCHYFPPLLPIFLNPIINETIHILQKLSLQE